MLSQDWVKATYWVSSQLIKQKRDTKRSFMLLFCFDFQSEYVCILISTGFITVYYMDSETPLACQVYLPVLHTIGLPALGQFQGTDSRLPPGGDIIISGIPVEIPTETTHLVLQPLTHCNAESVEAVVANLNVLWRVDDDEALRRGQTCHQPRQKWYRHWCTIDLE